MRAALSNANQVEKERLLDAVKDRAGEKPVRRLEEETGVSKTHIHRVRSGHGDGVSIETLLILADYLGVDYLFHGPRSSHRKHVNVKPAKRQRRLRK